MPKQSRVTVGVTGGVAAAVRLVRPGHQQGEVLLLRLVPREVRMDPLRNIPKQRLQARRRVELLRFPRIAKRRIVRLPRVLSRLLCPPPCRLGIVQLGLPLRGPRFPLVQLRIQCAHLPQITPLKALQLRTKLSQVRLALRKRAAHSRKLLALFKQRNGIRAWLENDFNWHGGFRKRKL